MAHINPPIICFPKHGNLLPSPFQNFRPLPGSETAKGGQCFGVSGRQYPGPVRGAKQVVVYGKPGVVYLILYYI